MAVRRRRPSEPTSPPPAPSPKRQAVARTAGVVLPPTHATGVAAIEALDEALAPRLRVLAADDALIQWHSLNTEVGVLKQWTTVWAVRELNANALDEDPDGATAEFKSGPAEPHAADDSGAVEIRNRILRENASNLTLRSFHYAAAPDGAKRASTSGQYGYGLKDAVAILAREQVHFSAASAHGRFELVVHPTTNMAYVAIAAPATQSVANTVVTILDNVRRADFDEALRQLIRFRARSGALKLVHQSDHGDIYQRVQGHEDDGGRAVFLLGQLYRIEIKHRFYYVFDIHIDKEKLQGRDKTHLPPNWAIHVARLVRSAPKEVFETPAHVSQVRTRPPMARTGNLAGKRSAPTLPKSLRRASMPANWQPRSYGWSKHA